jgi:hypothetical protein
VDLVNAHKEINLPRKKKTDNVVSLARRTNDSKRYTVKELLEDLLKSSIPDEYSRCLTFVFDIKDDEEGIRGYKFNYFTSGFKDRVELLGGLKLLESIITDELFE